MYNKITGGMVATAIILFATTTQVSALNRTDIDESPGGYLTTTVKMLKEEPVTKGTAVNKTLNSVERVVQNDLGEVTPLTQANATNGTHALNTKRAGGQNLAPWWEEPSIRNTIAAASTGPYRLAEYNRTNTSG